MKTSFGKFLASIFLVIFSALLVQCEKKGETVSTEKPSQQTAEEISKKNEAAKEDSLRKIQEQIKFSAMIFPKNKKR